MTLAQEAYELMQGQSDSNLRIIIALLKTMNSRKEERKNKTKRSGVANGTVSFSDTFDYDFDAMDKDVAALFNGVSV